MEDYLIVLGATATGKSRLALELAEERGGEIVNADAFQMYRRLDIGTAKPDAADRKRVPHHLLDVLDPDEDCTAAAWAEMAAGELESIRVRGRLPIVVGGTGLYLRVLVEGLSPVPVTPRSVRRHFRERLASEGLPTLRRELERLDPATAARLEAADSQRTLRALEVLHVSGEGLAAWWERPRRRFTDLGARKIGLTVSKSLLYDRISERLNSMVARGWVEEVRSLLAHGVTAQAPAFRAIGYRNWIDHLEGRTDFEGTLQEIRRETRRYAKRQTTWFRREQDVEWVEAMSAGRRTDTRAAEE